MSLAAAHPGPGSDWRPKNTRIALGVAVSLALHALLLSAYRSSLSRHMEDEAGVPRTLEVWLRPPQPKPAATPPAHPPAARERMRERSERRDREPAGTRRHPPVIALTPAQSAGQAPQRVTEPATAHFDLEAARRFARSIASERDPAKAASAVGQFPEKPLETETKAARAISSAYRPWCKDGVPGGLLAPIYLALKKKDSGCRW